MFPARFDYHRAATIDEAIRLLAELEGAKLIAGGHSLIPMMKLRLAQPTAVVDIGRCAELEGVSRDNGSLRVGALTSHAAIHASGEVQSACPLLAEAAGEVGDPQVRNKGTIGGNLAHADPASDLPAVMVALGARIHLRGPDGERSVAASEFFVDLLHTDLGPTELMTRVEVPVFAAGTGSRYLKIEHPASGYAVCGAAAVVRMEGGSCVEAHLAFNGVTAVPLAVDLTGLFGGSLDAAAIEGVMSGLAAADPLGDIYASGEYRLALARTCGARALAAARDRARG